MKVWVEKSIVAKRIDRISGDLMLGKALWSPTKDKRGADIYNSMRMVKEGDLVLHLVDNKAITGISVAESSFKEGRGAKGSDWEGPAYIVPLRNYVEINPPLDRKILLGETNRSILDEIRAKNKVFYNSQLSLNQGAYLTEAPTKLVSLIAKLYHSEFNKEIPLLKDSFNALKFNKTNYWIFQPGKDAKKWNDFFNKEIMAISYSFDEDMSRFSDKDTFDDYYDNITGRTGKMNTKLALWEISKSINIGDVIIVKHGLTKLLGYGVISSDYIYNKNANYKHQRKVDWQLRGEWDLDHEMNRKSLTDITDYKSDLPKYEYYWQRLMDNFQKTDMKYPLNTILYGPPGTGKTYNTVLKSAEIIENRKIDSYDEALQIFKDNLHDQIEFITFHQNYSYEDFIQGLRPETDNKSSLVFDKKDGIFKTIADKAFENLKLASISSKDLSNEIKFGKALESFCDKILDEEDNFKINDTAYIFEVEDDAFRYTGERWSNHSNGLRMKFSDLKEFYRNNVQSRKDVKKLTGISGLANQHATYYFLVYSEILKLLPSQVETLNVVKRKNYVIIIDEINRANISRVFGELITLIEPDKRSDGKIPMQAKLPSGDIFQVPSNLYIIGTMNTADKSIALLDIALRRRFEFEPMYPKYSEDGLDVRDENVLRSINDSIISDKGHDFQIGHSYFMDSSEDPYDLQRRMNVKVIPLLLEYFMNDTKTVSQIISKAISDTKYSIDEKSWPLKITLKND